MASIWEDFDLDILLASVNFCAQEKLDFNQHGIRHLQEARQRAKMPDFPLTVRQMRQKVCDLARKWSSSVGKESPGHKIIYTEGIKSIPGVPKKVLQDVGERVAALSNVYNTDRDPSKSSQGVDMQQLNSSEKSARDVADHHTEALPGHVKKNKATSFPTNSSLNAILKRKDAEITRIRNQWRMEVEHLHEREQKHKQVENELRIENTNLVLARQERERAHRDPLESQIFFKNQDIWNLTRRIQEMKELERFVREEPHTEHVFEPRKIDDSMERIGLEADSIVQLCAGLTPLVAPNFGPQSDLALLFRAISGNEADNKDDSFRLKRAVLKFGVGKAIRLLLVAALKDWVFSTKYPNFHPKDMRLLQSYRDIVSKHEGRDRLQNLDYAAHCMLIEKPRFTSHELPLRAARLAARFSRAVALLFKSAISSDDFEPWCEDHEASEDMRFRLTEAFQAALQLKVSTVMTDNSYEFAITQLGGGTRQDGPRHYASLHVYPLEPPTDWEPAQEALFEAQNFVLDSMAKAKQTLYTKHLMDATNVGYGAESTLSAESTSRTKISSHPSSTPVVQKGNRNDHPHAVTTSANKLPVLASSERPRCATCGGTFVNVASRDRHVASRACYFCLNCKTILANYHSIKQHQRDNSECQNSSPVRAIKAQRADLERNNEMNKSLSCERCMKTFSSKQSLANHGRHCPEANKRLSQNTNDTKSNSEVPSNESAEDETKGQYYSCKCGKQYKYKGAFERHKRDTCRKCAACNKWLSDDRTLGEHSATDHADLKTTETQKNQTSESSSSGLIITDGNVSQDLRVLKRIRDEEPMEDGKQRAHRTFGHGNKRPRRSLTTLGGDHAYVESSGSDLEAEGMGADMLMNSPDTPTSAPDLVVSTENEANQPLLRERTSPSISENSRNAPDHEIQSKHSVASDINTGRILVMGSNSSINDGELSELYDSPEKSKGENDDKENEPQATAITERRANVEKDAGSGREVGDALLLGDRGCPGIDGGEILSTPETVEMIESDQRPGDDFEVNDSKLEHDLALEDNPDELQGL